MLRMVTTAGLVFSATSATDISVACAVVGAPNAVQDPPSITDCAVTSVGRMPPDRTPNPTAPRMSAGANAPVTATLRRRLALCPAILLLPCFPYGHQLPDE